MSEEEQIPFNNRTHDRLTELERKVKEQDKWATHLHFDYHISVDERLEELEKKLEERGDNFKIYNAYAEMNERIEKLEKTQKAYIKAWETRTGTIQDVEEELSELTQTVENWENEWIKWDARITELEKKINEDGQIWNKFLIEKYKPLAEKIIWLSDENATLHTQIDDDALKRAENGQRIEKLEKHDIFRIWKSVRMGGKTTLDAMLNLNQGIKELKERAENHYLGYDNYIIRCEENREVLREFLSRKVKYGDEAIESMDSGNVEDMVAYMKADIEFYKGLLDKLGGENYVENGRVDSSNATISKSFRDTNSKLPSFKEFSKIIINDITKPSEQDVAGSASARESIDRQTDIIKWFFMEAHLNCLENFRIELNSYRIVEKEDLERWYYYFCYHDHKQFRKDIKEKYLPSEESK